MENPVTTAELFTTIVKILEQKNLFPDILEYCDPTQEECFISSFDSGFGIANQLDYGLSGGIYLDLWITDGITKFPLGVCKTTGNDPESMYVMAKLLADFIIEIKEYASPYLN